MIQTNRVILIMVVLAVLRISRYPRPNNVYSCPFIFNKLTAWVENTAWWGNPMIDVATNGTWYQDTAVSQFMPSTGYVRLPFNTVLTS